MIFFIVNYMFFEDITIGYDIRYIIYIFCLPLIVGIVFFGIYRKEFLIRMYLSVNETYAKIYVIGFYLIQGIIVSYLSFGQITSVIWNCINKKEAEKNKIEIVSYNVTDFYTRKNPHVTFKFKNRTEILKVSSETNRKNQDRNPKDYQIEITTQKGIWNYYIVKHWELKNIR
ncbi:hypothetical protein [Flavobacterium reichenbachii]|nr:hypothetical protein [Flavobacterium reichenbachii]